MTEQMTQDYETILNMALKLPPFQRAAMIEALAASFQSAFRSHVNDEDTPFTEAEVADLMHVEPLPPAEIVEQGLTGTWADLGIGDGAEWVNEQKRKRSEERRW